MLLFCPSCSNMLTISKLPAYGMSGSDRATAGDHRFECRTCPYQLVLNRRYYERKAMETQAVQDIMGGEDSWKNVDKTAVKCVRDNCVGQEAYFRQVQIRSADEPSTSFYRCVVCSAEWREN